MLNAIKNHWNRLVLFATSLVAMLSGFLVLPPYGNGEPSWYKYSVFLVAISTGLWLLPMKQWSKRNHAWSWWIVAGILAIVSTVIFFHYTSLLNAWTLQYWRDKRVVIGQTLTNDAANTKALQASKGLPTDDLRLLKLYAGDTFAVWNSDEIMQRQRAITIWYLISLLTLAGAATTITQASYCATRRRGH